MTAIASATGVSQSTAYTIPSLLMPNMMGNEFLLLTESKMAGIANQDGVPCDLVSAKSMMGPVIFSIDRKTKLIRKVDQTMVIDPKRMQGLLDMGANPR
jgi:hypothetical protein